MTTALDNDTATPMAYTEETWAYRGAPLLQTDPALAIPYLAVLGLNLASGTVGNLLVLGAIFAEKALRKGGYQLMVNLAVADLLIAGIADPMCMLGVTHGQEWFAERPWLCTAVASICLTACFCAFLSLTATTINRTVYIFSRPVYSRLFTPCVLCALCVFVWLAALCFELPNYVGWGGHYFDEKNHQCIWDRTASRSYTLFVSIVLLAAPLLFMTSAYSAIFARVARSAARVAKHGQSEQKKKEMATLRKSFRSCHSLIAIVLAYILCWVPYCVIIALDVDNKLPVWLHLWVTLLAHTHSSLNFYIYGITNPYFRSGYRKCLACLCSPFRRMHGCVAFCLEKNTSDSDAKPSASSDTKMQSSIATVELDSDMFTKF